MRGGSLTRRERVLAAGGIIGPSAFVAAWLVGGLRRESYSPVENAISRLAELGAPTRPTMTAGLVTFGIAVPLYSVALRSALPSPAWTSAMATGVATLAVAGLPLGGNFDLAHGIAAVSGYVSLAATPVLAAPGLTRLGRPRAARSSAAVGFAAAASLAMTATGSASGLWQRVGLTIADAWLVVSAVAMAREGTLASRSPHDA